MVILLGKIMATTLPNDLIQPVVIEGADRQLLFSFSPVISKVNHVSNPLIRQRKGTMRSLLLAVMTRCVHHLIAGVLLFIGMLQGACPEQDRKGQQDNGWCLIAG
jgi:hypothetical protein